MIKSETLATLRERERERERAVFNKINNEKSEGSKAFIKYIQNADYC